jgi:hypothetical protein
VFEAVCFFILFVDDLVTAGFVTFADAAFDDFHVWRRNGGLLLASTAGHQGKKRKNPEYDSNMTNA